MLIIWCWSTLWVTTLSVCCWWKVYTVGWLRWRCISEVLYNDSTSSPLHLYCSFGGPSHMCFCSLVHYLSAFAFVFVSAITLAFSDAHKRSDKVCVCAIFFSVMWLGGVGRLALLPAVSSYWFETCPLSLFPRSRRVSSLIPSPCLSSPLSSPFPRHHVAIGYVTAELAACSCMCVCACPRGWAREIKHDTCSFQA